MSFAKSSFIPLAAFLAAAVAIAAGWHWLGAGVPMPQAPLGPRDKLQCVSYAPFRGWQTPFDPSTRIERWQIEDDLARLKPLTDCIRTYSTELGLDQVPDVARRYGLKVLLGIWLGREERKNRIEIDSALALARRYPDVVSALVVGNEVLLRGELSAAALAGIIRNVKAQTAVPVTYADVWEFWTRFREVSEAVDFVTIHILPYWEDFPIPAREAAAHVASIRRQVAAIFPGKEILIGETGWPSQGRMREGALPSPSNQARVIQDILAAGQREHFRINLIEAFDQPWKRLLEGTVGGHWGLLDAATRERKFEWGAPVSDHPLWRWQAGGGVLLALCAFAAALIGRGGAAASGGAALWSGVAVNAVAGGLMAGLAAEKMLVESLGAGGFARSMVLVALSAAVPVAASAALARGLAPPAFARVLARRDERISQPLALLLGLCAVALTLMAIQAALGLAFDPRYRDFPFAALTAATIPLAVVAWAVPRGKGRRGAAEIACAFTLVSAAGYIAFNESFANWQSLWFCGAIVLLALTLLRARDARD
jgi:glucan 1,3-beta-glucosidase